MLFIRTIHRHLHQTTAEGGSMAYLLEVIIWITHKLNPYNNGKFDYIEELR